MLLFSLVLLGFSRKLQPPKKRVHFEMDFFFFFRSSVWSMSDMVLKLGFSAVALLGCGVDGC